MVIGYTTGVFDLFHVGHVNILRSSKEMCDYLIVGCTVDELVRQRKNKNPVIPYDERVEILRAVTYVDKVVPQDTMDKLLAYEKYEFNIMFVGDDWKGHEKWVSMEREFSDLGVSVVYFPYTKSTSSTKINRILDAYRC